MRMGRRTARNPRDHFGDHCPCEDAPVFRDRAAADGKSAPNSISTIFLKKFGDDRKEAVGLHFWRDDDNPAENLLLPRKRADCGGEVGGERKRTLDLHPRHAKEPSSKDHQSIPQESASSDADDLSHTCVSAFAWAGVIA